MIDFFPTREVALVVGYFSLHWYAILYLVAFAQGWWLLPRLQIHRNLSLAGEQNLDVLTWAVAGVLIGGRLGYVLLYEPLYYVQHPLEVFFLSQGGMSFHGGLIGVGVALWLASRNAQIEYLRLLDIVVIPAALGLALGRAGNWINQELFVSTAAHVLVIGKDLTLAILTYFVLKRWRQPGSVVVVFLLGYAALRFISEFWRVHEVAGFGGLSRGQLLCLPMFAVGIVLVCRVIKATRVADHP